MRQIVTGNSVSKGLVNLWLFFKVLQFGVKDLIFKQTPV